MSADRSTNPIDFDRLLKLRLVVARFGEMDSARWWTTGSGDGPRSSAVLGRQGAALLSRGFPRTHHFVQARIVFAVARARCAEVFEPPGGATLWSLPPAIEDQFESRWANWLEQRSDWNAVFSALAPTPTDLVTLLKGLGLLDSPVEGELAKLKRAAEGRSVPLPGTIALTNDTLTLLAAAFSRGEVGKPAIPFARLEE